MLALSVDALSLNKRQLKWEINLRKHSRNEARVLNRAIDINAQLNRYLQQNREASEAELIVTTNDLTTEF